MILGVVFSVLGYLSGSVLYAHLFAKLLKKENMIERSKDQNPGTANAFMHGGFWCGVFTLICDLLKGTLPVFLFVQMQPDSIYLPLVVAAPVLGHIFPLFYHFKGGKGIATTFGCLLGLLPAWQPAVILAVFFIFYSLILRITPHFHRTLVAFFSAALCMAYFMDDSATVIGFILITIAVCIRMFMSNEKKEKMKVKLLWMH